MDSLVLLALLPLALSPALPPRVQPSGRSRLPPVSMQQSEWAKRPMKDINKAGPSEERQRKINELMTKLRARGSVGDESLTGSTTPTYVPLHERPEVLSAAAEAAEKAKAAAEAEAEAQEWLRLSPEEQLARAQQGREEEAPSESAARQTTSGIGGTWTGEEAAKVKKHKPKVSTWGVFDRPADISKAYGGGRRIGVGGYQESAEEREKKKALLAEKMKEYRKSLGIDSSVEEEHVDEIKAAKEEAAQLMRFGDAASAVQKLESVRPWLCVTSDLGGNVLLDLGFNLIAAGRSDEANAIFKELVRRSPNKEVKRASQQCLFQEQAQSFLKVDSTPATNEFAKISRLTSVKGVKRYALADAYLSSPNRPPVATLSEARMVLRSAAVRRNGGAAPQRIPQALSFVRTQPLSVRLPQSVFGADGVVAAQQSLRGEWLLGLSCKEGKLDFAPLEANQQLFSSVDAPGSGSFERLARGALPALVRSAGTIQVCWSGGNAAAASSTQDEPKQGLRVRLATQSASLGPVPLPSPPPTDEEIVLLDGTICVTYAPSVGYMVWARPSMQAPSLSADESLD
ncbi:hypothetical protein AB1Y20_003193 [Prymnesium parvum]|uniref:Uncharacterized protein n=1 Tax=Prymnesium parvum TaxID=97485 RepID=A0AB34JBI5_PRYPA